MYVARKKLHKIKKEEHLFGSECHPQKGFLTLYLDEECLYFNFLLLIPIR